MSNPGLNRMLRAGLSDFHVGRDTSAVSQRNNPYTMFSGETYHGRFSAKAESGYRADHNFEKKENREDKGGKDKGDGKGEKKRKKEDGDSDSDDDDDGPHFKSKVPEKGSDGDGDGVKNEKRKAGKKGNGPWDDKDGDGKPNKVDKK